MAQLVTLCHPESIKEVPRPQTKVQSPLKMPGLVPVDYVWFFVVFTLNDSRSWIFTILDTSVGYLMWDSSWQVPHDHITDPYPCSQEIGSALKKLEHATGGPWRFFCCKICPGVWDMSQWYLVTPEAGKVAAKSNSSGFWTFWTSNLTTCILRAPVNSPWVVDDVRHWNFSICFLNKGVMALLVEGCKCKIQG